MMMAAYFRRHVGDGLSRDLSHPKRESYPQTTEAFICRNKLNQYFKVSKERSSFGLTDKASVPGVKDCGFEFRPGWMVCPFRRGYPDSLTGGH